MAIENAIIEKSGTRKKTKDRLFLSADAMLNLYAPLQWIGFCSKAQRRTALSHSGHSFFGLSLHFLIFLAGEPEKTAHCC